MPRDATRALQKKIFFKKSYGSGSGVVILIKREN